MKKVVSMIVLMLFLVAGLSFAEKNHGATDSKSKGEKVYCCHGKGDCDKLHTKAECEKDGGKVVPTCKDCK
jgi:hypothetical protein